MPYKVLIVEDNRLTRQALVRTVDWPSVNCMVVGEAANGVDGAEKIASLLPDIVVTDIKMPQLSGLDMVKLSEKYAAKVIFVTGYQEFDLLREALRTGAVDFILKPVQNHELEQAVKKATQLLEQSATLKKDRQQALSRPKCAKKHGGGAEGYSFLVQKVLRYISQHYREELTLALLAEQFYVHPTYLSSLIKKETGKNFTSFLSGVRLEAARGLLEKTTIKINDVAYMCGFNEYQYFYQVFKKREGVSPGEYRENCAR